MNDVQFLCIHSDGKDFDWREEGFETSNDIKMYGGENRPIKLDKYVESNMSQEEITKYVIGIYDAIK